MDDPDIKQEYIFNEEKIIPFEVIKQEDEEAAVVNMECVEIDEVRSPKVEEVEGPSHDNGSNIQTCDECNVPADCITQTKKNGGVAYFCTEKCMTINTYKSIPRPIQPQPTMQITDASSLYVRVCFTCSALIQINDYSNISWQARDFCNEKCLTKHQLRFNSICLECKCSISELSNFGKFSMKFGNFIRTFCSKVCLDKYKITLNMCQFCNNDISNDANSKYLAPVSEHSTTFKQFCSLDCVRNYCHYKLKLPYQNEAENYANCVICKAFKFIRVKFQNKDIITYSFCSEACFVKFQTYIKIDVVQCFICKKLYEKIFFRRYCLYDNGVKNFCGQNCQTTYYIIARSIVDCHNCKVRKYNFDMIYKTFPNNQTIYACSFQCLKNSYRNMTRPVLNCCSHNEIRRLYGNLKNLLTLAIARNGALANKKNASTMCYPSVCDASTSAQSFAEEKNTQTVGTNVNELSALIPTPVPIYVPAPVPAPVPVGQVPVPITVPVPIPIPVPIFVPTGCRTLEEVEMKMKKIWEELPQDPLQADLIMLAKTLNPSKAEEKKPPAKQSRKRKMKKTVKRKVVKKNYSYGYNTLRRWIITTNAQIKSDALNQKLEAKTNLFKTNLLFMTRDELHKCLIAFLVEIKGENSPDTLYTIFLDIQKYLLQKNKQEYIFLDPSFKTFIEHFNEISIGSPNSLKIKSKLTEDFLWNTNQLGTQTPYTLLNSLIYFNYKLFGLKTVQEHFDLLSMQITFSKNPKLNITETKVKYIYRLKYFPKMINENEKKKSEIDKQFYNQKRCPGYFYEFYIKKCPTNVEHGNKSFYFKPELACETDSPIWFSNQTLDAWTIEMMLNRIKMVKGINEM